MRKIFAAAAILLLAACGQLIPAGHQELAVEAWRGGAYRLDPDHASLLFKADHLGFSKLVGRFNDFDAWLDYDPDNPEAARLSVAVRTASLDVNNPDFAKDLRSGRWFDAANYPEAVFESRAITRIGENSATVAGDLTLRGVTRPVELAVTFNGGAVNFLTGKYTLGFAATTTLSRSAFGMDYLVPAVGDAVELEIHAEFQRVGE